MADLASQLNEAILLVCPIEGISIGSKADRATWSFIPAAAATPQQITAANAVLASFPLAGLTARSLLAIITDLNALTGPQKTAVWADLSSGNPPKWSLDRGPNAASIAVLQLMATLATLSAADMLLVKIRGVAFYIQDNPSYLVNPAFDASINIPGRA